MIVNHNHFCYHAAWTSSKNKFNGAYYYSKEITEIMIPLIKTSRNWITINVPGFCYDHSIVFIHNNLEPARYDWLKKYDDLILICGVPETVEKIEHLGKAYYLPLSVDVKDVERYIRPKTKDTAYVGRKSKSSLGVLPDDIDYLSDMPRETLLGRMAEYENIYAVGRTAIEGKILGCNILPYDERFPDTDRWQIVDTRDAAKILQGILDEVDND